MGEALHRKLGLPQRQFKVEWDKEYGIDSRTGWSVVIDGSVLVQFQRFVCIVVLRALWKNARCGR